MLRTSGQPPYGGYSSEEPSHERTVPVLPARQYTNYSKSSAFSSSANPDEDWTKIADLGERRRIQNRIAQRNYRKKIKRRLEDLQRRAGSPINDVAESLSRGDGKSQSLSPLLPGSSRGRSSRVGGNRSSSSSNNSPKKTGARAPRQKKPQHTLTSLSAVEAAVLRKQQQKQQQEQLRASSASPFLSREVFTPSLHGTDSMVLGIGRSVSSSISSSSSASSATSSSSAAPSSALAPAGSLYSVGNVGTTLDALDDPLNGMTFDLFGGSEATSVYSRGHSPLELPFHPQRHPSPSVFTTAATTPLSSSSYSAYPPPPTDLASLSDGTRGGSISDRSSGRSSSSTASGMYSTAATSDPFSIADRTGSTASTAASSYEYAYRSSWPLVVDAKDAAALTEPASLAPPYIDYGYLATTVANGAYDAACPPTPPLCSTYYSRDAVSCPETDFDFVGPTTPLSMAE